MALAGSRCPPPSVPVSSPLASVTTRQHRLAVKTTKLSVAPHVLVLLPARWFMGSSSHSVPPFHSRRRQRASHTLHRQPALHPPSVLPPIKSAPASEMTKRHIPFKPTNHTHFPYPLSPFAMHGHAWPRDARHTHFLLSIPIFSL